MVGLFVEVVFRANKITACTRSFFAKAERFSLVKLQNLVLLVNVNCTKFNTVWEKKLIKSHGSYQLEDAELSIGVFIRGFNWLLTRGLEK